MIAKRIDRKVENDNYRALALYIGGFTERDPEEKMLDSWTVCCAGEDYTEALQEIEIVQEINTSQANKTYHLILSFRPQDEEKLSPEVMRDIEQKFAQALGYAEHQRCCGVHKNTNNVHMHIAYNMINPETFKRHEQFRDFIILSRVCREVEQQYGLIVDNGMEPEQEPTRPNTKAQTVEAQTGQESFDSYVQRHKAALMAGLAAAEDWPDVHKAFAEYGIGIKPGRGRKGGLVLHDLHNKKYHITASSLDRTTSGPAMEKRFGSYEAAPALVNVQELDRYSKRPLHHEPNRDNLYERYRAALAEKSKEYTLFNELKEVEQKRRSEIYTKWSERRAKLHANTRLTSKDRWQLTQELYLKRSEELDSDAALLAATKAKNEKMQEIQDNYPFSSWTGYLKQEALRGNEAALDILRSKNIAVEAAQPKSGQESSRREPQRAYKAVLENTKLATKDKKRLVAVGKLIDKTGLEINTSISPSGVVILHLPSGGTVRDDGKQIHFSSFDRYAQVVAKEYAKIRWGGLSKQAGENSYVLAPGRTKGLER